MGWSGHLDLRYRHVPDPAAVGRGRTVAHDRHHGPLRVLQALYPEGDAVCHHVLVHPPGGIAGGDVLGIELQVDSGAHALVTTPSATRFYRTRGEAASQSLEARVASGGRLEWLPLETLVYPAAVAANRQRFDLAPGARMIGWDLLALGLPASGQAFDRGRFDQHLELPGLWLERGRIDATDTALLQSPIGWAGHTVLATVFAASGDDAGGETVESLLTDARAALDASSLAATAGATALPDGRGVVLRVLAPRVEPAMQLLTAVWTAWRRPWLELDPMPPRIWRM